MGHDIVFIAQLKALITKSVAQLFLENKPSDSFCKWEGFVPLQEGFSIESCIRVKMKLPVSSA
jgi:hypothetical protein